MANKYKVFASALLIAVGSSLSAGTLSCLQNPPGASDPLRGLGLVYLKYTLPAPSTVNATQGTYPNKVNISWNNVRAGMTYTVYRNGTAIGTGLSGTSFDDTTAAPLATYAYSVTTTYQGEESVPSPIANGFRSAVLTAGDLNVAASDGTITGKVRVSWSALANGDGYKIYRDSVLATTITNSSTTMWDDSRPSNEVTNHTYSVSVTKGAWESDQFSDTGYANVAPTSVYGTVSAQPGTNATANMTVVDPNANETQTYTILSQGNQGTATASGSSITYQANAVPTSPTDTFSVQVADKGGATSTGTVNVALSVGAATALQASDGTYPNKISLGWGASSTVGVKYTVLRDGSAIASNLTTLSYDDVNVSQYQTYSYTVKATIGSLSATSAPDTGFASLTASQSNIKLDASQGTVTGKIRLNWTNNPNADSAVIYKDSGSTPVAVVNIPTATWDDTVTDVATHSYSLAFRKGAVESGTVSATGYANAVPSSVSGTLTVQAGTSANVNMAVVDQNVPDTQSYTVLSQGSQGTATANSSTVTYLANTAPSSAADSFNVQVTDKAGASVSGNVNITLIVSAPTSIQATDGTYVDKVNVQWTSSSTPGVTYNVYRDGVVIASGVTGTSYDDTNIVQFKSYTYKVVAVAGALSSQSVSDVGFAALTTTQSATQLTATQGTLTGKVRLDWADNSNADAVAIYKDDSSTPAATLAIPSGTWTDNVTDVTSHNYALAFRKGAIESNKLQVSGFANGAPTATSAKVNVAAGGTVSFNPQVTDPNSGDQFTLTVLTQPGQGSVTISGNRFSYVARANATPVDTFHYRVTDRGGESVEGDAQLTIVVPPTAVIADDGGSTDFVHVGWTTSATANVSGYVVFRDGSQIGAVGAATLEFKDTTAEPHRIYAYSVAAIAAGTVSPQSQPDNGYRDLAPVQNVVASDGDYANKVQIDWSAIWVGSTYSVLRNGVPIATGLSATSYADTTATPFVTYQYSVVATLNAKDAKPSETDTGFMAYAVLDPAVVNFKATKGTVAMAVDLSWNVVSGSDGYQISRDGKVVQTITDSTVHTWHDITMNSVTPATYTLVATKSTLVSGGVTDTGYANLPPTASAVTLFAVQGGSGVPIAPDVTDPNNGETYSFRILSQPAKGAVTVDQSGNIGFKANANALGDDTFTYEVRDSAGNTLAATGNVSVLGAIQNVTASKSKRGGGVIVNWERVPQSGVTYQIYQDGTLLQTADASQSQFTDAAALPYVTHHYTVTVAYNGTESAQSSDAIGFAEWVPTMDIVQFAAGKGENAGLVRVDWVNPPVDFDTIAVTRDGKTIGQYPKASAPAYLIDTEGGQDGKLHSYTWYVTKLGVESARLSDTGFADNYGATARVMTLDDRLLARTVQVPLVAQPVFTQDGLSPLSTNKLMERPDKTFTGQANVTVKVVLPNGKQISINNQLLGNGDSATFSYDFAKTNASLSLPVFTTSTEAFDGQINIEVDGSKTWTMQVPFRAVTVGSLGSFKVTRSSFGIHLDRFDHSWDVQAASICGGKVAVLAGSTMSSPANVGFCAVRFTSVPDGLTVKEGLNTKLEGVIRHLGTNQIDFQFGYVVNGNFIADESGTTATVEGIKPAPPTVLITLSKGVKRADGSLSIPVGLNQLIGTVRVSSSLFKATYAVRIEAQDQKPIESETSSEYQLNLPLITSSTELFSTQSLKITTWYPGLADTDVVQNVVMNVVPLNPNVLVRGRRVFHSEETLTIEGVMGMVNRETNQLEYTVNQFGQRQLSVQLTSLSNRNAPPIIIQGGNGGPDGTFSITGGKMAPGTYKLTVVAKLINGEGQVDDAYTAQSSPVYVTVQNGSPIPSTISSAYPSGAMPYRPVVTNRLSDFRRYTDLLGNQTTWEISRDGNGFVPLVDDDGKPMMGLTALPWLHVAGTAKIHSIITNRHSGLTYTTNDIEIAAFAIPKAEIDGPSATVIGTPATLTAKVTNGLDSVFKWEVLDPVTKKVSMYEGSQITISSDKPQNFGVTLYAAQVGAPLENNARFSKITEILRVMPAVIPTPTITGPRIVEADVPNTWKARINSPFPTGSATPFTVAGRWILPNGQVVDGSELTYEPVVTDKILTFEAYLKERPEVKAKTSIGLSTWKYKWPIFGLQTSVVTPNAPAYVRFQLVPQNYTDISALHGEPLTYQWELPPNSILRDGSLTGTGVVLELSQAGQYQVRGKVSDSRGNVTNILSDIVNVLPPKDIRLDLYTTINDRWNRAPSTVNVRVIVSDLASNDTVKAIRYLVNDAEVGAGPNNVFLNIDRAGQYTITVEVTTATGRKASKSTVVNLVDGPKPICKLTPVGDGVKSLSLTASCTATEGSIMSHRWKVNGVDSPVTATTISFTRTQLSAGITDVAVTATNDKGQTGSSTWTNTH